MGQACSCFEQWCVGQNHDRNAFAAAVEFDYGDSQAGFLHVLLV